MLRLPRFIHRMACAIRYGLFSRDTHSPSEGGARSFGGQRTGGAKRNARIAACGGVAGFARIQPWCRYGMAYSLAVIRCMRIAGRRCAPVDRSLHFSHEIPKDRKPERRVGGNAWRRLNCSSRLSSLFSGFRSFGISWFFVDSAATPLNVGRFGWLSWHSPTLLRSLFVLG